MRVVLGWYKQVDAHVATNLTKILIWKRVLAKCCCGSLEAIADSTEKDCDGHDD